MSDVVRDAGAVEVHLEELGHRSWLAAAANTLLGNVGSAQFRFVARPVGDEAAAPVLVGATFPVMRWQDLSDRSGPNAWIEVAESRLDELDGELAGRGWVATGSAGRHWWSRRYERSSVPPR